MELDSHARAPRARCLVAPLRCLAAPHAAEAPRITLTTPEIPYSAMLRRAIDWMLPEDNPAGVIYGTIMIGAVLAAESGLHDSYLATASSAVLTVGVYWLAHTYADLLGRRLAAHEHLTMQALLRALAHDWAIVRGTSLPLLALLVAWATGTSQFDGGFRSCVDLRWEPRCLRADGGHTRQVHPGRTGAGRVRGHGDGPVDCGPAGDSALTWSRSGRVGSRAVG